MWTHEDYVNMLERIPADKLKTELIRYFQESGGVTEAREVLVHFLTFYTTRRL